MKGADEAIITKILNGDQQAYAELVDKYKDRVFSLVIGIVRNQVIAEELAQDIFVKVYHSLSKFRGDASFSSWLYRIAYNTAISETRKRKVKMQPFEDYLEKSADWELSEIDHVEENEARHILLERAIKTLEPEEKLILMLYYFEDHSVDDISRTSGLSQSNVKVKLFRLRSKLKGIMEQMGSAIPAAL